jgi:hypothetical protein
MLDPSRDEYQIARLYGMVFFSQSYGAFPVQNIIDFRLGMFVKVKG